MHPEKKENDKSQTNEAVYSQQYIGLKSSVAASPSLPHPSNFFEGLVLCHVWKIKIGHH